MHTIPLSLHFTSPYRRAPTTTGQLTDIEPSRWAFLGLGFCFIFPANKSKLWTFMSIVQRNARFFVIFFFSYQQTGPSSHLRDIARIGPAFVVTPGLCGFYRAQLIIFFLMEVLNFSEKKELGRREQMEASLLHDSFFLHQSFKLWQTEKQRHCTLY